MTELVGLRPVDIAQGQLDAYNAQDLDAFLAFYAENVAVHDFPGIATSHGVAAMRSRYAKLFADFPQNHADVLARIVIGPTVIDHERVTRTADGEAFEVAVIYTIADGKIARVEFVK